MALPQQGTETLFANDNDTGFWVVLMALPQQGTETLTLQIMIKIQFSVNGLTTTGDGNNVS